MANPVWSLSVDLQTKTAVFQSGMADAARSARSAFNEIKSGAADMGEGVSHGSLDVRHSLGLVDNVIRGAHSQAMADLIRMYAQSALVMTALPIAATAAGFALVAGIVYEAYEKLKEYKEQQEKLGDDFMRAGTVGANAFRGIGDQILRAEQHADELRNDHLGALKIQLELIDHQSLDELVKSFETVAKAAGDVFKDLEGHWYSLGIGSAGASHALDQFKVQYENLLALGKDKEAADLLAGTRDSAQAVLNAQRTMVNGTRSGREYDPGDNEFLSAKNKLQQAGVGYTKAEIESQQQLVNTLNTQVGLEAKIAELKKLDQGNARTETGRDEASRRAAGQREAVESQLRMGQSAIAADKATADAQLEVKHASVEAQLASDLSFAQRSRDVQLVANQELIAGLDTGAKDYNNQLQSLRDKAVEIEQDYEAKRTELTSRAQVAQSQRDIQEAEASEKDKIAATEQGSAERLAAIEAALKQEESLGLQSTNTYRELQQQKTETQRAMAAAQAQQAEAIGHETAEAEMKSGEQRIAAMKTSDELYNSEHRVSDQQRVQQEIQVANEELQIKMQALQREIATLDASGKQYQSKLKALQDQEKTLVQQHENEITQIKTKAEIERNQREAAAQQQASNTIAASLTQTIMRHQTYAQMMTSLGNQVVSGLLQNALQSVLADDFTKERDAAAAARKAYLAGMQLPFPANIIAAPALAAGAFASVMAFEGGTDSVPGYGVGDTVPAKLTPGEGVVPGGVMDGLRDVARNGGFQQKAGVHYAPTFAPQVHAVDAEGVDRVLTKHAKTFQKHAERAVRKLNK